MIEKDRTIFTLCPLFLSLLHFCGRSEQPIRYWVYVDGYILPHVLLSMTFYGSCSHVIRHRTDFITLWWSVTVLLYLRHGRKKRKCVYRILTQHDLAGSSARWPRLALGIEQLKQKTNAAFISSTCHSCTLTRSRCPMRDAASERFISINP